MLPKTGPVKKTLSVLKHSMLPTRAWHNAKESKNGVLRIVKMLRTGKAVDPSYDSNAPIDEAQRARDKIEKAQIDEGRAHLMQLEAHERFEAFVEGLGWEEKDITAKIKWLKITHSLRFGILVFSFALLPFIIINYGIFRSLFLFLFMVYTIIKCLKDAGMIIQMQERALWSFAQLRARPDYFYFRKSFWFQD